MNGIARKFRKDYRGVALAEFVIAFYPLLMMFLVFSQVAHIQMGHLMFRHAAIVAARCSVVSTGPNLPGKWVNDNDKSGGGMGDSECKKAAVEGLGYWNVSMGGPVDITSVTSSYNSGDQYGDMTTTVKGTFNCTVPWAHRLVCGGGFLGLGIGPTTHAFTYDVKLPHEGAQYTLE